MLTADSFTSSVNYVIPAVSRRNYCVKKYNFDIREMVLMRRCMTKEKRRERDFDTVSLIKSENSLLNEHN